MVNSAERISKDWSPRLRDLNEPSDELAILNERRCSALELIDDARFSWIHAKICLIAGIGFFTDAYDTFVVGIMVSMLGHVQGNENGDLSPWQSVGLIIASPIGNLVGQVLLGWLADALGRKRIYGVGLVITVTATFGQALAGPGYAVDLIRVLILWRFIMGIGRGDSPVATVIISEFSPIRTRGRLMTAAIAFQGWGQLAAGLVGMIVVGAYGDAIRDANYPSAGPVDYTWRLLVGFGCIPGLIAYCLRLTIPETPRFTMDVKRNITRASRDINKIVPVGQYAMAEDAGVEQIVTAPRASLADFIAYFSKWDNLKVLVGAAYSWFAFGVAFYSLTLNSAAILTYGKVDGNSSDDVFKSLFRICSGNLILTAVGAIPGFWACFCLIDSWGRKPIQLMGFTVLNLLFLAMSLAYVSLHSTVPGQYAFIALCCLVNFFQNFGPHTTSLVITGETFPTRYRATAHGLSAACGRVGAIAAQLVIGPRSLDDVKSMQLALGVFSFIMFTGVLSTLLLPETKCRTLEELSNEHQESFVTCAIRRGIPPPCTT